MVWVILIVVTMILGAIFANVVIGRDLDGPAWFLSLWGAWAVFCLWMLAGVIVTATHFIDKYW